MTAMQLKTRLIVRDRVQDIRSSWSEPERRARARQGVQRRAEFLHLIEEREPEAEVWAGGALDEADLKRMAS